MKDKIITGIRIYREYGAPAIRTIMEVVPDKSRQDIVDFLDWWFWSGGRQQCIPNARPLNLKLPVIPYNIFFGVKIEEFCETREEYLLDFYDINESFLEKRYFARVYIHVWFCNTHTLKKKHMLNIYQSN